MAIKELAVKQAVKRILPLVGNMSDSDLEGMLSLLEKLAPHEYAKSMLGTLSMKCREQDPTVELLRRLVRQTSPRVRERIVNSLVIKNHWYGGMRRRELEAQGMTVPWAILISPTMRCNLRCTGCYSAGYGIEDDLEFEVMDRVLTEGEDMGIFVAVILGGEPFIRDDIWELYRRHKDIVFQVFTNGTTINERIAKKIERLGNVLVIFSLEGFEEDTDSRRGRGVFAEVMRGMDNLREVGAPFGFSSMVTRYNVDTIVSDEFNDMLIEKGCLLGWHFLYMPIGREPDTTLMPTAEQRALLRERGAPRLRREKPILAIDFWNDAPVVGGCIAGGRYYLHINNHGDVEPCIFVHLATDNIKQKSLRDVIDSPYFRAIRARQPYSDNLLRPCMIIDHPHVLRELVAEHRACPTEPGAETIITELSGVIDQYAEAVAIEMDPIWQRDFVSKEFSSKIK
jgi:MoaA/NifB/PqqE/SkfB family radical SAM enzyme